MGLLSKKRTFVASTAVPLVLGNRNSVAASVSQAMLTDTGIMDNILYGALTGGGLKLNQAYEYGRDHYTLGLPQGTQSVYKVDTVKLQQIIEGIVGSPITLKAAVLDRESVQLLSIYFLVATRGIDPSNKRISNVPVEVHNKVATIRNHVLLLAEGEARDKADELLESNEGTSVAVTNNSNTSTSTSDTTTTTDTVTTVTKETSASVKPTVTVISTPTVTYLDGEEEENSSYVFRYDCAVDNHITKTYEIKTTTKTTTVEDVTVTTVTETEVVREVERTVETEEGTETVIDYVTEIVVDQSVDSFSNSNTQTASVTKEKHEYASIQIIEEVTETQSFKSQLMDWIYMVEYEISQGEDNPPKVWVYKVGSGTYPLLDNQSGNALPSPFFPIVPVRYDNVDLTSTPYVNTPQYLTGKVLLKKVGLDIAELGEEINKNPDVGDIDHGFVFFGVQIQSKEKAVISYLVDFFEYLGTVSEISKNDFESSVNPPPVWDEGREYYVPAPFTPVKKNLLTIANAGMKIEVFYNYVDVATHTGSIGSLGHVTQDTVIRASGEQIDDRDLEFFSPYSLKYERSELVLRKQVSPNSYKTVRVHGLEHVNHVYEVHTVTTTLEDSINPDNKNFVLPLHSEIIKRYSLIQKNDLAIDSVQLVFNSYEIVKLKWYQTGFFKFVIMVISIYFGAGAIAKTVTAVTSAATVSAAITVILKQILISMAINAAFRFLVRVIGNEAALFLAIIAAAYLGTKAFNNGSSLKGVPWAEELVMAVNGLSNGIQSNIKADIENLIYEREQFDAEADEKLEKIETAQDLLEVEGIVDPFVFTNFEIPFYSKEKPSEFYDRTIHSGNVGILALDAIHEYVDNMLRLPETIEDVEDVRKT